MNSAFTKPTLSDPTPALRFDQPVVLVGGGAFDWETYRLAEAHCDATVAADGGANWFTPQAALFDGRPPLAGVVGDMDSITDLEAWRAAPGCEVVALAEQDSTDLEKCLYSVAAPLFIGVGFLGARFDHSLASLHALLKFAHLKVLLVGDRDVMFLAPPSCHLRLNIGARVSLYPLRETIGGCSTGLEWPIDGLTLAAGAQIGTSNKASAEVVALSFSAPGVLTILDRVWLDAAIVALGESGWRG